MVVSTDREPPAWLLDELDAGIELPDEIPDWVLHAPFDDHEAGHACSCTEPAPETVQWAVPGLWDQPRPVTGPSPEVLALQVAWSAVEAMPVTAQPDALALADTQALLGVQQRTRVHLVRRLADVDDRELFALAGARTTRSWLKEVQPDADASDVSFGRTARHHRFLQAAVEAGDVSINAGKAVLFALGRCGRHVDNGDGLIDGQPADEVIAAVVGNIVTLICSAQMGLADDDPLLAELVAATEQILAEGGSELDRLERAFTLLAQHVPLRLLRPMLEELFLAIVPSELDRRNDEAEAGSSITRRERPDGRGARWVIDPSPELDERLLVGLHAEMRRDSDNPLDTAAAAAMRAKGLDPHNPDDYLKALPAREPFSADRDGRFEDGLFHPDFGPPRNRSRRMHDAFNRMLGRYLESGLAGSHHKVPVQINVTVSEAALRGVPGALPAKTDSGQLVGSNLLRRWWCDSRVTAFVLSKGGKALRAVHAGRTLTALERRAALIEQGNRCAGVGCCRGSTREDPDPSELADLRPHHVRRFADDGVTCIEETVMICDTTHFDIHEGGKTVRLRNGRYLNESGWVDPASLQRPDAPF